MAEVNLIDDCRKGSVVISAVVVFLIFNFLIGVRFCKAEGIENTGSGYLAAYLAAYLAVYVDDCDQVDHQSMNNVDLRESLCPIY